MAFTKVLPAGISSATNLVIDSINSAGVVTATGIVASTGTFSGNVSIAGTLTYEDVTNIDSVGIITARSGLHVTGGSVGIGTDNPTAKFELSTNNAGAVQNNVIRFTDTDKSFQAGQSPGRIEWNTSDANSPGVTAYIDTYGYTNAVSDLVFGTGAGGSATERLRILHTGNIGIGTDAASNKVSILVPNETSLGSNSDGIKVWDATKQLQLSRTGSSYSYGGVTGTGSLIYSYDKLSLHADTSNPITFATGGSERLRVDSSGNIAIGSGGLDSLSARTSQAYQSLRIQNANITAGNSQYAYFGVNYYQHTDGVIKYIDAGYSGRIDMWGDYMSFNLSNGAAADDNISNSERMRIDSSGRLIIGHNSARANINNWNTWPGLIPLNVEGANAYGTAVNIVNNYDGNGYSHLNFLKSNTTSVGSNTLVANGNTIGMITFQGNDGTQFVQAATISAAVDDSSGADDMPGRLVFAVTRNGNSTTSTRMTIVNTGELRLGTTSQVPVSTDNYHSIGDVNLSGNTSNLARLVMQERSGDWISFKNGSGVHYGTISINSPGVNYGSNSDYRLKNNVENFSGGIDLVKRLRPVTFNWNELSGNEDTTSTQRGFLAHEVQEVEPAAVSGEKDEMDRYGDCYDAEGRRTQINVFEHQAEEGETWTLTSEHIRDQQLDPAKLVPILTAALKESIAKIESLEARLDAAGL